MSKLKNAAIGLISGVIIGYSSAKMNAPKYSLFESKGIEHIYSNNQNKSYRIYEVENDFFIGSADYNMQGAVDLAYSIGFNLNKHLLDEKTRQYEDLEDKLKGSEKKIRRRKFFDKIDETRDKIRFWYKDLKRRQLE